MLAVLQDLGLDKWNEWSSKGGTTTASRGNWSTEAPKHACQLTSVAWRQRGKWGNSSPRQRKQVAREVGNTRDKDQGDGLQWHDHWSIIFKPHQNHDFPLILKDFDDFRRVLCFQLRWQNDMKWCILIFTDLLCDFEVPKSHLYKEGVFYLILTLMTTAAQSRLQVKIDDSSISIGHELIAQLTNKMEKVKAKDVIA
jgi:hypothetical protein